jgi:hypothetical protein
MTWTDLHIATVYVKSKNNLYILLAKSLNTCPKSSIFSKIPLQTFPINCYMFDYQNYAFDLSYFEQNISDNI